MLQGWVDEGKISKTELKAGLDKHLKRKDERELFGLEPLPDEKTVAPKASTEKVKDKPAPSPTLTASKTETKATTASHQETAKGTREKKKQLREANQENLAVEFEGLE